MKREMKSHLNIEVVNQLKGFLDQTYKMMELCQRYRGYNERKRKFSPSKLKQMEAKLKIFDIE